MKKAFYSNSIYTEQGEFQGYLIIENDRIVELTTEIPKDMLIMDYSGYRIIPGIIDIHNHGYGGWSMTDMAGVDDVLGFAKALTSVGVIGVLPTANEASFKGVVEAMDKKHNGATIYGIHSEGPFWARGGENTIGVTWPLPSVEETKRLVEMCDGKMKMMAIAPELPNAYDVIEYLHKNNIKVACCHTKANAHQIKDANKSVSLDIATHLGNGMQGIHHRDVGALGGLLLEDDLMYEMIADLNHLCPDMIKIMLRCQPYYKFCLISDSNFIAGLPSGRYERYGREMFADDKGLIKNSDGRICGSGKWVLSNMRNLEKVVGVPFEQIIQMASLNPARFLGVDDQVGSLKKGKKASFTIIDENYNCQLTYVNGFEAYNIKSSNIEDYLDMRSLEKRIGDL